MPSKKKMRTEDTHLVWADDEIQLLLEATSDFKGKKAYGGVDWERIKDKYAIRTINKEQIFVCREHYQTILQLHLGSSSCKSHTA